MKLKERYLQNSEKRKKEFVRSFIISLILFIAFLLATISVYRHGFLDHIDQDVLKIKRHTFKGMSSHILLAIDDLGLRGFTATVLITVAILVGIKKRSYRPFNLSVISLLALNGVVGIAKLSIGRTKPRLHEDIVHSIGLSYPSGHAANALISWGLLSYILVTSFDLPWLKKGWLYSLVGFMTLSVCIVSLMRNTHWFSDLLGGVLLGGSILVAIVAIDRFFPSQKQVR
jgi:membrane-associated phospholipid phosphatase